MPISREDLHTVIYNWTVKFCMHGIPNAANRLTGFSASNFLPQEGDMDQGASTYFENHRFSAMYSLKGMLAALGFKTNLRQDNLAATKHSNRQECSGWAANRGHHIEELYGLLTDLENWQPGWRGQKTVLNALKITRMLSRQV